MIDNLEAGYTNDPNDPGGETKWGISKRAHPAEDIANLTRDDAIRIYHEHYWRGCHADLMPPPVALMTFCSYVNMNPKRAVQCLQRAAMSKDDGILGPKTLFAVQHYTPQRELRARLSRAHIEFYTDLARARPYALRYLHGWIGRVCRVADEAGAWGASG